MRSHARHDLVWLNKSYICKILPDWQHHFVVTNQTGAPLGHLNVACCLNANKTIFSRRMIVVPIKEIIEHQLPVNLRDIIYKFNLQKLNPILDKLAEVGVVVRIYGSFSWEHLTKQKYTNHDSDLDLLFYITNTSRLQEIKTLIFEMENACDHRIDGELIFSNGTFIAWREWFNQEENILIKTTKNVLLCKKSEILAC